MVSATDVVEGKDRRTPPKSPLAADAKPFVPSSASPIVKAAAAEEPAEKEREEEEEAKRKESEEEGATDEGDDDDDDDREAEAEEQPPAPVKTFPVFTDQQRSRPSMQVRRGRRWRGREREPRGESEGRRFWQALMGAASCQLCVASSREALFTSPTLALRFPPRKKPKHT